MKSMSGKIDAIIFDKDGTLFDFGGTWGAWCNNTVMELSDGDADQAKFLGDVVGYDIETASYAPNSVLVGGTADEIFDLWQAALPKKKREHIVDVCQTQLEHAVPVPIAGLENCLRGLTGMGVKLAVATNDYRSIAEAQLSAVGLLGLFELVNGFDSVPNPKPAPDAILDACARMGVAPDRSIMVGDSVHDLHAARAAGAMSVAVLSGPADEADLTGLYDHILPDVTGLSEVLT